MKFSSSFAVGIEDEGKEEGGREEGLEEQGNDVPRSSRSTAAATEAVSSQSSRTKPPSFPPPSKKEERREGGREGGREGELYLRISPFLQPMRAVKGLITTFTPSFFHNVFLMSFEDFHTGERPARARWERREERRGGGDGAGDGGKEEAVSYTHLTLPTICSV